jgi:transcriptional regulator with XRE-family HTH domain
MTDTLMTDTSPIPKRLKEARLRADISQKELGILAGIDEFSASPRINQYEKGKHTPDFLTLERLSKVLDVPVPYFFTKDESLAELILIYGSLSITERNRLLKSLRSK